MNASADNIYTNGQYLSGNPSWHEEDAPFKARHIAALLARAGIRLGKVAEVGCGTGGVIRELRKLSGVADASWSGFDISEDAIARAQAHPESKGIRFEQTDFLSTDESFDVLMMIDVFEHIPDYMGFLASCRPRARYKVFHIPLDVHVSAALRDSFVQARESVGHLHYFSERTARATLVDTGYKIIDAKLTPGALELFSLHPSLKRALANIPRYAVGLVSPPLATRLFGGYSLLVLAE